MFEKPTENDGTWLPSSELLRELRSIGYRIRDDQRIVVGPEFMADLLDKFSGAEKVAFYGRHRTELNEANRVAAEAKFRRDRMGRQATSSIPAQDRRER